MMRVFQVGVFRVCFDIGTAGSNCLLMQVSLLRVLFIKSFPKFILIPYAA